MQEACSGVEVTNFSQVRYEWGTFNVIMTLRVLLCMDVFVFSEKYSKFHKISSFQYNNYEDYSSIG
jgi:hypothetical protein